MNRKRQSVNAVIRNRTLDTKYLKLKDVARFSSAKTTDICLESYISTENMIPFLGGVSTASSVPDVKSASLYEEGDILLSNIRLYFCKIWKADKKGACSNDVLVVKPKNNIDPTFLYYCLCDKNFFNYADLTSKGTKMPRGTKSAIMKYLVPNIPLCTQNMIASILSNYDKLIQNYKKQIEDLQNLASELYKEWFVRFRFPGHEKTSFENGIPAGWKYVKISTAYNSSSGGTPSRQCLEYYENGIYPWIKTGELKDSLILESEEYITESAIQNSSAKLFEKDSLIIAMYGATIGQIGINKMQATCNQACCVLRPKDNVPCGIYYLYMFFLFNRNYLISLGSGAAQQNLSQVVINKLNFLLPKTEVIEQFEKLEKSIFDRMCVFQKKISVISKQRDLLLPRLMSGELEVK